MNAASLPRTCAPWSDASCSRVRDESAVSDEKDFFLFRADPGRLVASVYPISHEDSSDTPANLDAKIELWRQRSDGTWTSMATQGNGHSASDLFARLSYNVPTNEAGVYAVAAKSQGGYGDLGEYTVEVRGEDVREYTLDARLNLPEGPFVTAVPKTVRPGETVTLHGGGFATASSLLFSPLARASVVQFNGIGVPTSVRSSTELTFEVPVDGFCGEHYIRVVNPPRLTLLASEGDKLPRASARLEVVGDCAARPAVHIYRIFPTSARPGTNVTIDGLGFRTSNALTPLEQESVVLLTKIWRSVAADGATGKTK